MTTSVKVEAHCGSDTEVQVIVTDGEKEVESLVLQDGENTEKYVHGDLAISVQEVTKLYPSKK